MISLTNSDALAIESHCLEHSTNTFNLTVVHDGIHIYKHYFNFVPGRCCW